MFSVSLISLRIRTCSRFSNVTERALSISAMLHYFNGVSIVSNV